jgi:ribosomal protein RSM22 (predicted rRNA methylase)
MRIPETLRSAIEAELASVDSAELKRAAAQLSVRYRSGKFTDALNGTAARAAYLATRLPATYAANDFIFREFAGRVKTPVRSLLDLGAGPGTAMWAAAGLIGTVEQITAVEQDVALIDMGRRLASRSENIALQQASWKTCDLRALSEIPAHDVVVLSYAIGELQDPITAVQSAWRLASVALVLIEPGTPKAFNAVLCARDWLIADGATIASPCPHHNACPLAIQNDWCHFSARLERTADHRRLKGGDLGYEDEKFSYIIACKSPVRQAEARIVRHPLKHPGHVKLTLCTPSGLQTPTISKSQKQFYRSVRKAEWGGEWPPSTSEIVE